MKFPRGHHCLFPSTSLNHRITSYLFKCLLMLKYLPSVLAISKVSAASAPTSVPGDEHTSNRQAAKVHLYNTTNQRWLYKHTSVNSEKRQLPTGHIWDTEQEIMISIWFPDISLQSSCHCTSEQASCSKALPLLRNWVKSLCLASLHWQQLCPVSHSLLKVNSATEFL